MTASSRGHRHDSTGSLHHRGIPYEQYLPPPQQATELNRIPLRQSTGGWTPVVAFPATDMGSLLITNTGTGPKLSHVFSRSIRVVQRGNAVGWMKEKRSTSPTLKSICVDRLTRMRSSRKLPSPKHSLSYTIRNSKSS
jgi:hypothetical protein